MSPTARRRPSPRARKEVLITEARVVADRATGGRVETDRLRGPEGLRRAGGAIRLPSAPEEAFDVTLRSLHVGDYLVFRLDLADIELELPGNDFGGDEPRVAVGLNVGDSPLTFVDENEGRVVATAEGWMLSGTQPMRVRAEGETAALGVILSAATLRGAGIAARTPTASIPASNPLMRGLAGFAAALLEDESPVPPVAQLRLSRVLDSLVVGLYLDNDLFRASDERLRDSMRLRVLDYVGNSFTDPNLRPEVVARRFSMSSRTLQRLFEGSGTTVAREIHTRRMEHAHALLVDPRHGRLGIGEIASRSGFSSAAHLRRSLIAALGAGPREIRAGRVRYGGSMHEKRAHEPEHHPSDDVDEKELAPEEELLEGILPEAEPTEGPAPAP